MGSSIAKLDYVALGPLPTARADARRCRGALRSGIVRRPRGPEIGTWALALNSRMSNRAFDPQQDALAQAAEAASAYAASALATS
jgi:hypothetical protein